MILVRSARFKKEFDLLPRSIKIRTRKQFALFLQNPQHPSLGSKKMAGWGTIWEGRITRNYRFTFQMEGEVYTLRRIGKHDILSNP